MSKCRSWSWQNPWHKIVLSLILERLNRTVDPPLVHLNFCHRRRLFLALLPFPLRRSGLPRQRLIYSVLQTWPWDCSVHYFSAFWATFSVPLLLPCFPFCNSFTPFIRIFRIWIFTAIYVFVSVYPWEWSSLRLSHLVLFCQFLPVFFLCTTMSVFYVLFFLTLSIRICPMINTSFFVAVSQSAHFSLR